MTVHGFQLVEERPIPEINTQAKLYRHVKTGARLLALENDDENKVFGISFATLPEDSTGVPHILEHSVLCGSRNFPVKEPFKELRKGSLNTFLNAFTSADKTMYPIASQNQRDFYNLIRVYLDAVFNPFITPETLQRQGWHYELAGPDGPLTYKGVVFNEMKGVYSSPDSLINRYSSQTVFPDTVYGVDSGGDPAEIPNLTYKQFRSFYERHYHPSNAYIVLYGDDRSDEPLRLLDEYLSNYEAAPPAPPAALQPRFSRPRHFAFDYDAGEDGEDPQQGPTRRSYLTVNWLLNDVTEDVETSLTLQILGHILVGTPASPLRKALIDSGLGDGLTRSGYDGWSREATFSAGLKGIAAESSDQVEQLILDTLGQLVEKGIDPNTVEASLNTIEFQLREANTGAFPRGLVYMLGALASWTHGGDPLAALAFEEPLTAIKSKVAENPRFFEELIQAHLIDNPHRTVVLLKPDPQARERAEAAERERLRQARADMDEKDLKAVFENAQRLEEEQNTPDPPEALATIPSLTLSDLDRENKLIPITHSELHGVPVLTHDLFTNGIVYLDVGLDLRRLPVGSLPYAGLFGRLLLEMGTEREDFVRLSQRIGRDTGGISRSTMTKTTHQRDASTWLFLRGKATVDKGPALLDILRDLLLTVQLDGKERFRQIVLQEKAGLETSLLPSGHIFVSGRLSAQFSEAGWVSEHLSGVDYLFFLRRLAERIETDWPGVLTDLRRIHQQLVNRNTILCNVTVDQDNYQHFQPELAAFLESIPAQGLESPSWDFRPTKRPEGLTIPAQVNYVGKGASLYDFGYQPHGSTLVTVNLLGNTWLWDRVRVQGGAYGGFCTFNRLSGMFTYLSYRDPNLLGTLQAYDGTGDFLRSLQLSEHDVEKVIIGVIGKMDAYMLPDAKGYTSMVRHLTGETDELRQELREEVLGTTADQIRAFASMLDHVAQDGVVVTMGPDQAMAAANETLEPKLQLVKLL